MPFKDKSLLTFCSPCAGEIGAVQSMEVRNVEGVATHNGPESCGDVGNGVGEALTGEHTGRVLNREIKARTSGCRRFWR